MEFAAESFANVQTPHYAPVAEIKTAPCLQEIYVSRDIGSDWTNRPGVGGLSVGTRGQRYRPEPRDM